jgi:NAD(P)H-flavin reductase
VEDGPDDLTFLINVRGGFTKRLGAAAKEDKPVTVFVDGPYGEPQNIAPFDMVVLIAGGAGVSYTLPLLEDVIA